MEKNLTLWHNFHDYIIFFFTTILKSKYILKENGQYIYVFSFLSHSNAQLLLSKIIYVGESQSGNYLEHERSISYYLLSTTLLLRIWDAIHSSNLFQIGKNGKIADKMSEKVSKDDGQGAIHSKWRHPFFEIFDPSLSLVTHSTK